MSRPHPAFTLVICVLVGVALASLIPGWPALQAQPYPAQTTTYVSATTVATTVGTGTITTTITFTPPTVTTSSITVAPNSTVPAFEVLVGAAIGSDAVGLVLIVDGQPYNISQLPATFRWPLGSEHTVEAAAAVASSNATKRYVWTSWSDGGERSHGVTMSAGSMLLTANFRSQVAIATTTKTATPISPSETGLALGLLFVLLAVIALILTILRFRWKRKPEPSSEPVHEHAAGGLEASSRFHVALSILLLAITALSILTLAGASSSPMQVTTTFTVTTTGVINGTTTIMTRTFTIPIRTLVNSTVTSLTSTPCCETTAAATTLTSPVTRTTPVTGTTLPATSSYTTPTTGATAATPTTTATGPAGGLPLEMWFIPIVAILLLLALGVFLARRRRQRPQAQPPTVRVSRRSAPAAAMRTTTQKRGSLREWYRKEIAGKR